MSNELINKGSDVTRSMVQKAVVILASKPIFGPTRTKLGMVTHAFFAQRDLQNITLIKDFYNTLEDGLEHSPEHDTISPQVDGHNTLYMGTSIREFIFKWRFKVLVLLKLLLLQRKVCITCINARSCFSVTLWSSFAHHSTIWCRLYQLFYLI